MIPQVASGRARVRELLGVELPLIQAPVGSATSVELAAAVSEAGALGTLAMSWRSERQMRQMLGRLRASTDRPWAVNLVLEWDQHVRLEACLEEGARIVSFFWGDPQPYIADVHAAGGVVLHTVGDVDEARRAVDAGADAIIAQGWEAGGHVRGKVATMALVPAVVDAVGGDVPVLAAGGIADGRGVAAALALGAGGCDARHQVPADARVGHAQRLPRRAVPGDRHRHRVLDGLRRGLAGTRHIARSATARSARGSRQAARPAATGPARAR